MTQLPLKMRLSRQDEHEARIKAQDTMFIVRGKNLEPRAETMGKISRDEGTLQGFRTEYAIARLFGVAPPDINFKSDGGIDLWVGDCAIDVKCTATDPVCLIFDSLDKFGADVAILVKFSTDSEVLDIYGWVSKSQFGERCYAHNFGYGDRLVVNAENLNPIETLWRKFKLIEFSH